MHRVKNCLIVDDCDDSRFILWRLLIKNGFVVDLCESTKLALEKCQESIPDIIFLDWIMPNLSGIKFMEHFSNIPGHEKAHIIMCTAIHDKEHVKHALLKGAKGYLAKPFGEESLIKQLKSFNLI